MKTQLFLKKINTLWKNCSISCNTLLTVCFQCQNNNYKKKMRKWSIISVPFGKVWTVLWFVPGKCRAVLFNFCLLQDSICHTLGLGHQCIERISKKQSKGNEIGLMPVCNAWKEWATVQIQNQMPGRAVGRHASWRVNLLPLYYQD